MLNKKIASIIAIILVTFFILSALAPIFVYAEEAEEIIIYEKTSEEIVAQGVSHKRIVRFTNNGWLDIQVIEADLSEKYLDINLLTDSRGVNYMSNVLKMAQENDTIAAINADFFQRLRGSTDQASAVGVVVENGEMLSSPAHEDGMASLSVDSAKKILFDYWNTEITITAPNNKSAVVKHINKYDPLDSIVLYDRNWNTHSLGSTNNIAEIVVENNIVKEIRREMPPVEIPVNGYVLCNLPEYDPFLIENFKVGDPIKLEINTQPNFHDLKLAVGGGTLLVKDGAPAPFTHRIKGLHPRSAIGTDASGKKIFMVTVDGRQITSKGMTQEELANLLIELGVYYAINLDGGGSTTLVSKSLGEDEPTVVNKVSDGWLRNVTNAIGITTSAPKGNLAGLVIETVNENVFVNTSRAFEVKGYDKYYNAIDIDMNKVQWQAGGVEGTFKGNTFYPTSVGHGLIKATYDNVISTYGIDVLSAPASIDITPKRIDMRTGDTVKLSITGKNRNGYSAPISLADVQWEIPNHIAEIQDNYIIAIKRGIEVITATVGEVNTHASVAIDFETAIDDFEDINGTFLPYPSYVNGNYTLSSEQVRSGNYSGKLTFDFTSEQNESKAAYFNLKNDGIMIPENVNKIGLWVYANDYMEHWLRGGMYDTDGNFYRVSFAKKIDWNGWKYIEADIPENLPQSSRFARIYIVQIDPEIKNKGSIYFDDLSFVSPETEVETIELPEDAKIPDELNEATKLLSGESNYRFTVFGNTIQKETLLEKMIMSKLINTFNQSSSLSAFVGNINSATLDGLETKFLSTSGYQMFDYNGSTFLYMDNTQDGFRKTNSAQWSWFKNALEEMESRNVFIFLPKPLTGENGFTDTYEAELFKDMLTEDLAKKGRTVFVFYNDTKNTSYIDRGVRYISTPGITKANMENIVSQVEDYKYIQVTVNGNDVSYEIKNLFR